MQPNTYLMKCLTGYKASLYNFTQYRGAREVQFIQLRLQQHYQIIYSIDFSVVVVVVSRGNVGQSLKMPLTVSLGQRCAY